MTKPSPDESSSGSTSALKELILFASGLPYYLKFVVLGVLVIGGGLMMKLDQMAIAAIAFLIVLGLVIDLIRTRRPSPDLRPKLGDPLAVGVLSFAEVGTGGSEEAQGDGFAEELITRLNRIGELKVKPRHTMLNYKGKGLSTRQIARRLQVNYLVEGTLRQHGDRCRVNAGVIQAWDLDQWRKQWERPLAELFELQSDVAEGVAEHMMRVLRREDPEVLDRVERTALRQRPADNVPAHYEYNLGRTDLRDFNNGRDLRDFDSAKAHFVRALELDDNYVDARSELGFLYLIRWETDGDFDLLERSAEVFRRVRQQDPSHHVAVAELGYIALVSGRIDEALELVTEAAASHPRGTIPQNVLALLYMYLGFYESAVHLTKKIIELDPEYVYPPTNASTCCLLMGDCDAAVKWAERAEDMDPSAFIVPLVEGAARFCNGELTGADRVWRRGERVAPSYIGPLFEVARAWVVAARGDKAAARTAVIDHRNDEWLNGAYDPYFISLCALAGEHDLALDFIERQVTWGSSYRYLIGDPTLRSLRDHPRFQELLQSRHTKWRELTERLRDVPVPPPELPTPQDAVNSMSP